MALLINGQRIDESIVESEFSGIKAYHENLGNVSCCERDPEFRQMAKDSIAARVLLAQEAERVMPPTDDAVIDAALDKLKEEYGGEAWFFSRTGLTAETVHLVRRDIDLDYRTKAMSDQLVDADGPASDQVLQAYYHAHIDAFMTPEQVQASHIIKNIRAEDRLPSIQLLRDLRKQLQAGADFETLAKQHSDRGEDLIDLGWFKLGEIAPEFEVVAFSMEIGEISPVFTSPYGMHIVKVTDRRPSMPRPFPEAREDVEKHRRENIRTEKTRTLVDELKSRATVEEVEEIEAPQVAEVMSDV